MHFWSRSRIDFRADESIVTRLWQPIKKSVRAADALFSGRISTWEALIATERSCLISTLSRSAVGGIPARNDQGATLIWRGPDKPDDWGEKGHSRYIYWRCSQERRRERRAEKRRRGGGVGAASRSGYTHTTISAPIPWNGRHLKTDRWPWTRILRTILSFVASYAVKRASPLQRISLDWSLEKKRIAETIIPKSVRRTALEP